MGVGQTARILAAFLLSAALSRPAAAFDLEGHRGTRGLAPENTLAAFRLAWERGVKAIELDVHLANDGTLFVCHDKDLNA